QPADNPVTIPNLYATIMKSILDTTAVRSMTGVPESVNRVLGSAPPIRELM
ncbi:MAG: DUF1501 domain-containing protein, partial [Opitutae bacterium]|nr:DUF1501 domain-containing protein [Opitutae bacterium]